MRVTVPASALQLSRICSIAVGRSMHGRCGCAASRQALRTHGQPCTGFGVKVIVTCGPSYEPIDQVRRITNFSTGELGVQLAERWADAGVEVLCFKGEAATWADPCAPVQLVSFSTNDDLLAKLHGVNQREKVAYFFHAAALADFRLKAIEDSAGRTMQTGKVPSGGEVTLRLETAPKIIASLRALFPTAWIAGWKYEVEGGREEAIAKAASQLVDHQTDACFVNGPAYGAGFGQVERSGVVAHYESKEALCDAVVRRFGRESARNSVPTDQRGE